MLNGIEKNIQFYRYNFLIRQVQLMNDTSRFNINKIFPTNMRTFSPMRLRAEDTKRRDEKIIWVNLFLSGEKRAEDE